MYDLPRDLLGDSDVAVCVCVCVRACVRACVRVRVCVCVVVMRDVTCFNMSV